VGKLRGRSGETEGQEWGNRGVGVGKLRGRSGEIEGYVWESQGV